MSQRNKALLLTVVVLLAVVLVALLLFLRAALDYKGTVESITIQEVDLSQVADGTYTGSCDAGLVSAQVAVTVEDGAITEVSLTDYHSILGRGAETIPGEIVAQQRIGVDAVSGATDSSTVIQKAVENALTGAG